jgi:hypothetical protein
MILIRFPSSYRRNPTCPSAARNKRQGVFHGRHSTITCDSFVLTVLREDEVGWEVESGAIVARPCVAALLPPPPTPPCPPALVTVTDDLAGELIASPSILAVGSLRPVPAKAGEQTRIPSRNRVPIAVLVQEENAK